MFQRLATEEDKKKILELVKTVANDDIKSLKSWWNAINYFATNAGNETFTYVFTEGEEIIGFLYFLHKKKKNVVKLYAIASFKKGTGTKMMEWLVRYSKDLKCEYLEFDSDERFSGFKFFTEKLNCKPIYKKDETHWYFRINFKKEFW